MKIIILNITLVFFTLTIFTSCSNSGSEGSQTEQTEITEQVAGLTYTCPMHPEVISDKAGKCPKCGMFLEKIKAGTSQDSSTGHQHEIGDQH